MQIRPFLVVFACFGLYLSACQPAPTSPPEDLDALTEETDASTAVTPDEETSGVASDEAGQEEIAETEESEVDESTASEGISADAETGVVAVVNGVPIELAEFQRQAFDTQRFFVEQGLDPNTEDGQMRLKSLRRQVLDDMINQLLIEQAGEELGIEVTDRELDDHMDAQIANVGGQAEFEATLLEAGTTMEEVLEMERAALFGQKVLEAIAGDVPATAEAVNARHILCDSLEACEEALQRIEAGEAFEDVASDVSIDSSSADQGGDLGWVGRGMLPSQQVEDAIYALEEGERSAVVATDFGYHVFEVLERDADHPLTDEQKYQMKEKALLDWLAERRSQSTIEILVDDLKDVEG